MCYSLAEKKREAGTKCVQTELQYNAGRGEKMLNKEEKSLTKQEGVVLQQLWEFVLSKAHTTQCRTPGQRAQCVQMTFDLHATT